MLMFLLKLASRRQFNLEARAEEFLRNLNCLAGTNVDTVPHDSTIAYFLELLRESELATLPGRMTNRLIRMKALDKHRLFQYFLIAIDGTGTQTFRRRHCPYCLTTTRNGRTLYYHEVLEAKLVTASGMVFSIASEFIENTDPKADRQDCELKAFYRMAPRLKKLFPQLRVCLLLDGLYAKAPVFKICRENNWRFIITLKKGSIPDLYREYRTLRRLSRDQRLRASNKKSRSVFAWVNDLKHQEHPVSVVQQVQRGDDWHNFVWVTNFAVSESNVRQLAEMGGRSRWKIENVGFRTQKHGGYDLEHDYSRHDTAAKNFYYLLQAAHTLNQLMVHGSLLKDFQDLLGSLRNFSRRLAEHMRNRTIEDDLSRLATAGPFQIRLDTS